MDSTNGESVFLTLQILRQQRHELEFFEPASLQRMTGLDPKEGLLEFLVKELIDNALDKTGTQNITVSIHRHRNYTELSIQDDGKETFTEDDVRIKLLDFDKSVSSKRGRKIISRGVLGAALQLSIGLTSVAWNGLHSPVNYIVKITSAGKTYFISASRKEDEIQRQVRVEKEDRPSKLTIVSFILPLVEKDKLDWIEEIIYQISQVNPHVTFCFRVKDRPVLRREKISDKDPLEKSKLGEGMGNIHCYSLDEFARLAEDYSKLNIPIVSFVQRFDNFKTESNALNLIRKAKVTSPSNLYPTMKEESRQPSERELPFLGEEHFKRIFGERFAKYKKISGLSKDSDSVVVPWTIELVSFWEEENQMRSVYEFVNFSYSASKRPFTIWHYRDHDKTFDINSATEKSGMSLVIHGISPAWRFEDQGKGQLDCSLFKDKIPRAVKSVLKKSGSGATTQVQVLREILLKRIAEVHANPDVIKTERWTQSTVFYLARKISPIPLNRKSFTAAIRSECKKLGFRRHELGIKAADRAQLYFRGSVRDVGLEEIEELAKLGTDIVFIEKEGACEVLSPLNHEGIALLNSRGFAVEYAVELMALAYKNQCNPALLTDLDASGLLMAEKLEGIPRIGISIDTLEKLGIDRESVEESYKPLQNHYSALRKTHVEEYLVSYVRNKRIEIDSVLAEVGPQAFWKYLLEELGRIHKTRDYTRALNIDVPGLVAERYLPLIKPLVGKAVEATKALQERFKESKKEVRGFLTVDEEEAEFEQEVIKTLDDDKSLKEAENKVRKILNFQS